MSRSSKGFADFFPTAPSVLQQKRSKPLQGRKRPRSPPGVDATSSQKMPLPHTSSQRSEDGRSASNAMFNGQGRTEQPLNLPDDGDTAHGDLLNGVGSASSTSTSSSLFSINQNHHEAKIKNGSASLTPNTNVDSPPQQSSLASPRRNQVHGKTVSSKDPPNIVTLPTANSEAQSSLDRSCGPSFNRTQAQPQLREWKGARVIYDPELDSRLTSREEKKGRSIEEIAFCTKVSQSQESSLSYPARRFNRMIPGRRRPASGSTAQDRQLYQRRR